MMLARFAFITRAYRARVGPLVTRSMTPIASLRRRAPAVRLQEAPRRHTAVRVPDLFSHGRAPITGEGRFSTSSIVNGTERKGGPLPRATEKWSLSVRSAVAGQSQIAAQRAEPSLSSLAFLIGLCRAPPRMYLGCAGRKCILAAASPAGGFR